MSRRVFFVADPDFSTKVERLLSDGPAWLVSSPANDQCAQTIWAKQPHSGLTIYKGHSLSPEAQLIENLATLEDHQGPYSQNPPFFELHVIGAKLTQQLKLEMEEFGYRQFTLTKDGFIATLDRE